MPKRSKKEKTKPNTIIFLVEGDSEIKALELPLSNLLDEYYPDYNVRFLLQERSVTATGDEADEGDSDTNAEAVDNDYITEIEYEYGGDITSSAYVTPQNIELRIYHRFILPAVKRDGIYPKKIAKIIHIVDLDGTYISDDRIVPFSPERIGNEKAFYNEANGTIENTDLDTIKDRNKRKRKNIDYLLSLSETSIKISTKSIPYEIYFFSSNLDHFINNDANIERGKLYLADQFLRSYGLDTEAFVKYFLEDECSIGKMGYNESWRYIKEQSNSLKRLTNIDCLIRRIIGEAFN